MSQNDIEGRLGLQAIMPVSTWFRTYRREPLVALIRAARRGEERALRALIESLPDPTPPSRRRQHIERARTLAGAGAPSLLVEREHYLSDRQRYLLEHGPEIGPIGNVIDLARGPRALAVRDPTPIRWLLDSTYRDAIRAGERFRRYDSALDRAMFGTTALTVDGDRPFPRAWENDFSIDAMVAEQGPSVLFHWHEVEHLARAAAQLERAASATPPTLDEFRQTYAGASIDFTFFDEVPAAMIEKTYPRLVASARKEAVRIAALFRWAEKRRLCVDVSETEL